MTRAVAGGREFAEQELSADGRAEPLRSKTVVVKCPPIRRRCCKDAVEIQPNFYKVDGNCKQLLAHLWNVDEVELALSICPISEWWQCITNFRALP